MKIVYRWSVTPPGAIPRRVAIEGSIIPRVGEIVSLVGDDGEVNGGVEHCPMGDGVSPTPYVVVGLR